ncbi:MAG TPA: hypothetical protein VKE95_05035 [Burkholderiales bacterium]|nr:hypothetical protein [Burkholderiales bacterium]
MRAFIALAAASLAAACSSLRPYPSVAPENVVVKSKLESGSIFSSMRGSVHIHELDAACHTNYVGTVKLDQPSVAFGLPAERARYLVFAFDGSSFLGGTSSSTSAGTVLKPRAGYRYEFAVTYKDSIYNVVLRESDPRGGGSRELPRQQLKACGA